MQSPELESKRIFLIAHSDPGIVDHCKHMVEKHIASTTVFTANDGTETLFKAENVAPHVVILDSNLLKIKGFEVARKIFEMKTEHTISVILLSDIPEDQTFINEVVTGQVQFLSDINNESLFNHHLIRALNRVSLEDDSIYKLRFIGEKQTLFNEGEKAENVYIVRKGELEAIKNLGQTTHVLGKITAGEFVGEMAHFNGENRSATVKAISNCELIEIPVGTLDMVLFSKPAWSKALVTTLSKRLKRTNAAFIKKGL